MTDSSPQSNPNAVPGAADVPAAAEGQQQEQRRGGRSDRGERRGRRGDRRNQERDSEWQERVVQIRRVSKTVKGGKKMSFRAIVVVGNEKGQVGIGVGKAGDVIGAVRKGDKVLKPTGGLRIEDGDRVLIFALSGDVPEVERLLQVSIDFF